MTLPAALSARAQGRCELCGSTADLRAEPVAHAPATGPDGAVVLCGVCAGFVPHGAALDPDHLRCLQESAWSGVPAVQVTAWRLLHRLGTDWAVDLAGQIWMEDDVRAWAEAGLPAAEQVLKVVDSNGTPLADGDTVTLIKDLQVKGAGFTAKRGTTVKNIRLGDDPTHIEGRVNKQAIYLKTEFLKKLR